MHQNTINPDSAALYKHKDYAFAGSFFLSRPTHSSLKFRHTIILGKIHQYPKETSNGVCLILSKKLWGGWGREVSMGDPQLCKSCWIFFCFAVEESAQRSGCRQLLVEPMC